jgi:peptidoglycan/xylan/chitin deacetylase (PgdA/CDA1 family)
MASLLEYTSVSTALQNGSLNLSGVSRASRRKLGKRDILGAALGNPVSAGLLKRAFARPSLLCINYHRVANHVEHDDDTIAVTPAELEWQADWLRRNVQVLGGNEIMGLLRHEWSLTKPMVCLTFDDGYADNFAAGRMLMTRFGISAMFFIPTGFIETGVIPPWDRMAYALKHTREVELQVPAIGSMKPFRVVVQRALVGSQLMQIYYRLPGPLQSKLVEAIETAARVAAPRPATPLFMTWDQIRELHRMGHTIGAHTVTHPVLATQSPAEQRAELTVSRQRLEEQLGVPVPLFAYPFGKLGVTHTETTQALVQDSGFTGAFTNEGGWNPPTGFEPFNLRRLHVNVQTSRSRFRVRVLSRGLIPV